MTTETKCSFSGHSPITSHTFDGGTANKDWWPNQLRADPLNQHSGKSDPPGSNFNYHKSLNAIDYDTLKADLYRLMTGSQDWWPVDSSRYGPQFIRITWHAAGTYRMGDGRGGAGRGQQRFAPLSSWPDNVSIDKSRRLLWPTKQKYGQAISQANLLILTGNAALETMDSRTFGFTVGREDTREPNNDVYWGNEAKWSESTWYSSERNLADPLAAVQVGLVYVDPRGPERAYGDSLTAVKDTRETFARMAIDNEETAAFIVGGHTFGKTYGAGPASHVDADVEAAPLESQGLGWANTYGTDKGADTITNGLEVTWTQTPAQWNDLFFGDLLKYEWVQKKSPVGTLRWMAKGAEAIIPGPTPDSPRCKPAMLTTDLSLHFDPTYEKVSRHLLDNPQAFAEAFARAQFKLTYRDLGSKSRYLDPEVPCEDLIWQDLLPAATHKPTEADIAGLRAKVVAFGLSAPELAAVAWASASTFRGSDKRGGANGVCIRLTPRDDWAISQPVAGTLAKLEEIQRASNKASLAGVVVLAGNVGIELAVEAAGTTITVPFAPSRVDATVEQTDAVSFSVLEPIADGFHNYQKSQFAVPAETLLFGKVQLLTPTASELTVLIGGLRATSINADSSQHGVLTHTPGALTDDFLVSLSDMSTEWRPASGIYEDYDHEMGERRWTGTCVDLAFGSNSILRAFVEVFDSVGDKERFISELVAAWVKVISLDWFDLVAA